MFDLRIVVGAALAIWLLCGCVFSPVPVAPLVVASVPTALATSRAGLSIGANSGTSRAAPTQEQGMLYQVITDHLNIRSSPGYNWPAVGWLNKGDQVTVLKVEGDWARIENGWVHMRYITPIQQNHQ